MLIIVHICHLCRCQEKFRGTLTFTYDNIVSTSTNYEIFFSMTYVNVSFIFVKVGFIMSRLIDLDVNDYF